MVLFSPANPTKRYAFSVERFEPTIDLAVLKVTDPKIQHGTLEPSKSGDLSHDNDVKVVGWPEFAPGADITTINCKVVGAAMISGIRRVRVSANIVEGNSGGPILDRDNRVVGVAVTGTKGGPKASATVNNSFIPISALKKVPLPKLSP